MSSQISEFLATGRELNDVERVLATLAPTDPQRAALSRQADQLQHQQQTTIAAALRAGVNLDTIEFALAMHGQGADRDPHSDQPTPAQQLLDLMQRHGAERVIEALDAAQRPTSDRRRTHG